MTTIWCQWPDLNLPADFTCISKPIAELTPAELSQIEIYVPQYMGGVNALSIIPQLKNLKVLQLLMAGYDDALAFKRDGVRLFNARGVHDFSTAELTLGLIISSLRGIDKFVHNKESGTWDHQRLDSIYGKKVAIVGAGSVASKISAMLNAFEVKPEMFARSSRNHVKDITSFDAEISDFDIIILIVPLNDETKHFMNSERINKMKQGALLINVARGPVVDTSALLSALNEGKIRAAVDVTDPEPLPPDHQLWQAPNLIISPHVGGNSSAFEPHGRKLIEEQCLRFASNQPLINEIAW